MISLGVITIGYLDKIFFQNFSISPNTFLSTFFYKLNYVRPSKSYINPDYVTLISN